MRKAVKRMNNMPTHGEIIKDLATKLERQLIIDSLLQIQTIDELKAYIEQIKAAND